MGKSLFKIKKDILNTKVMGSQKLSALELHCLQLLIAWSKWTPDQMQSLLVMHKAIVVKFLFNVLPDYSALTASYLTSASVRLLDNWNPVRKS